LKIGEVGIIWQSINIAVESQSLEVLDFFLGLVWNKRDLIMAMKAVPSNITNASSALDLFRYLKDRLGNELCWIHVAAKFQAIDVVEALLEAGFDPNYMDTAGMAIILRIFVQLLTD
jgi:hypothetical protein